MTAKVIVGTPCRTGEVSSTFHAAICRLLTQSSAQITHQLGWLMWDQDIVRVRSRMARAAIDMQADYLFYVDSDVSFVPDVLDRLIACDVDLVGIPYARKVIHWERLPAKVPEELYEYPVKTGSTIQLNDKDCAMVDGLPGGCTLVKVSALKRMVDAYPELQFMDVINGEKFPTAALFQLMIKDTPDGRDLLSEDYSFCERAKAIGIQPHLYFGPGSPADHMGGYLWKGWRG